MLQYVVDAVGSSFNEIAEIQNLTYPIAVQPNVPFDVSYDALNKTNDDLLMFGYVSDGVNILEGSEWELVVYANSSQHFVFTFSISQPFSGNVTIGHLEEPPPVCNEGETKCEGYDLYECINGEWVLIEENSPICGAPVCNEGETKCEGYDLWQCINGQWVLIQENSPQCGAPTCNEGETICVGPDLYECINGQWVLVLPNAPQCAAPVCNEGEMKCEVYDLWECIDGNWVLVEQNSLYCGYPGEQPPVGIIIPVFFLGVIGLALIH